MIESVLDRNLLPDVAIRAGIRRIVAGRLREQEAGGAEGEARRRAELLENLHTAPIAPESAMANAQHYELPPAFFERVLGPHVKYSGAWWPPGVETLEEAERRMLELTVERAGIEDGHQVLDLGCGWGSMTLFLAAAFPRCRIVALSNSAPQRAYIVEKARGRGLTNVTVITADINQFETAQRFDRIVSIEMLEHVRNYPALFARIARWLEPDGRFFAHVFAHRRFAYPFESRGASDWMARHFFTGGMMPSDDLFHDLQGDLVIDAQWRVDGRHYQRTAEAWLQNMDRHRLGVDALLASVYGPDDVTRWRVRWRVFFMACAEMFGYRDGHEWGVSHFRFKKRGS